MKRTYYRIAVVAALGLVSSLVFAGGAAAHHGSSDPTTACDQVLTSADFAPTGTFTLTHDVGPCLNNGLVIEASGTSSAKLTVDLNGKTVSGQRPVAPYSASLGAGVLIEGQSWVEVKGPGTVQHFSGGVEIRPKDPVTPAGNNRVIGLTIQDNVGNVLSDWGEGIGIWGDNNDSTPADNNNTVTGNKVDRNGPFAGIGVYDRSSNNTIDGNNQVRDNNYTAQGSRTNQDDGIRLEPWTTGNEVTGNEVTGSGLDGIAVFADATKNKVRNNQVHNNGHHLATHRKGEGIRVFLRANKTTITGNQVSGNAAAGIRVDSNGNTLKGNIASSQTVGASVGVAHGIHVSGTVSSGVVVGGKDNTVGGSAAGEGNTAIGNANSGIRVDGLGNGVNGNTATGNNPTSTSGQNDLYDSRDDQKCGNVSPTPLNPNHWGNLAVNTFGNANRDPLVTGYADCIK